MSSQTFDGHNWGIENFDRLILMIKKWFNDACVGCDGEYKSKNMIFFLTLESFMIEKK
jgi:hypothetical protein